MNCTWKKGDKVKIKDIYAGKHWELGKLYTLACDPYMWGTYENVDFIEKPYYLHRSQGGWNTEVFDLIEEYREQQDNEFVEVMRSDKRMIEV